MLEGTQDKRGHRILSNGIFFLALPTTSPSPKLLWQFQNYFKQN